MRLQGRSSLWRREMGSGRRGHFTYAWWYADKVREGGVGDLRAGRKELVEERKGERVSKQRETRRGKRRR